MYIKKYEQIENIIDRGKVNISWQLIGAVEIKERDEGEREGEREHVMMIMRSSRTARELMMLPPHKLSTPNCNRFIL